MSSTSSETKSQRKFYDGRKVLVAGGAGFIGSFLVEELIARGARVYVLLKSTTDPWRLRHLKASARLIRTSGKNEGGEFARILKNEQPEIVCNLAALTNAAGIEALDRSLEDNFFTALGLLRASHAAGTARFIQIGTIAEYGTGRAPFREDHREEPTLAYAVAKVMATHAALWFGNVSPMQVSVIRPAAVYGPRQTRGMLIPNLIMAGLEKKDFSMNAGKQLRDFVFVRDLVDGILRAGASKKAENEIINLGGGRPEQVRYLAETANRLMGYPIQIHFGKEPYRQSDSMRFYMDIAKAKKLLGWKPTTTIDRGLRETIQWYRDGGRDFIAAR